MNISRNSHALLMAAIQAASQGYDISQTNFRQAYPYRHLEATHQKRALKRKKRSKHFAKKR